MRPATIDRRAFMSRGGYQYQRSTAPRGDRCYHAAPMADLADRIRTRIVPALLTALGVTFLAAGVLSLHDHGRRRSRWPRRSPSPDGRGRTRPRSR